MTDEQIATVLVVDDDENQRWMVQTYLQKHGFAVKTAKDGAIMRQRMSDHDIDIVLLDVSMPGEDGFTLARYLREYHNVGIVMLTAAAELFDRVLGLEIGADDYITKPYEPRELMARVKAVLRRITENNEPPIQPLLTSPENDKVQFGEHTLDLAARQLTNKKGQLVTLTSMEFDLLKAFAQNPGRVLTRDNLLSIAHKTDWDPFDRSVDIRIGRVRRKIETDPSKPKVIRTIRGSGYIYVNDA